MNLLSKRLGLVLAGVVGVGAIASLAIGASFALFNSTAPTQNNTFTAGTISLNACGTVRGITTSGTPGTPCDGTAPINVNVADLEPGDHNTSNYVLELAPGSDQAYVGLNISWTSTAVHQGSAACRTGAPTLANCTTPGSLPLFYTPYGGIELTSVDKDLTGSNYDSADYQVVLDSQNGTDITANMTTSCTLGPTTLLWTCSGSDSDIEVFAANPADYGDNIAFPSDASPTWTGGTSQLLQLSTSLPLKTSTGSYVNDDGFEGVSGSISITGFAVQSDNNEGTQGGSPVCASGTTLGATSAAYVPTYSCPISWS